MQLALPDGPLAVPEALTAEWVEQYSENRWLGLGDTSGLRLDNPFNRRTPDDVRNPHLHLLGLLRRPEYFGLTARVLFGLTLAPFQLAVLRELWVRPFPMLLGCRGMGKSWLLALYCMLRALFNQGSRIVIVGAAFRQAKVVFDYCQEMWEKAPVLRSLVGESKRNGPKRDVDRVSLRMGDSLIVGLPLGDGGKIRGQRANVIIADEFAMISKDIFERVVRGFGAVSLSPVEKFRGEMRKRALQEVGLWTEAQGGGGAGGLSSNQTVVSGTAFYSFNHFYEYWKQYKAIVESRGDPRRVAEIFAGEVPDSFDWRDYSVIRVPVTRLPPGFMDDKQIAQAKATVHVGTYLMEYGACFATDSNGFYKRSLVEGCVVGRPGHPVAHPSCGEVRFNAVLRGHPDRWYVIAVDPASERDNLSVVVLECWPEHRRVVYCWTTTRARHKAKLKRGLAGEADFYAYAARKVRDLMGAFPCRRLAIDSQGGGVAVMEALQDPVRLHAGERPLYPVVDPEDPRDTDGLAGEHVIEVVSFASSEWVSKANHGMRKDFEDRALLFPEFDPAVVALSLEADSAAGRVRVDPKDGSYEKLFDTLEDAVLEIEDLKEELATIVHTQTGQSLRDRWDTPETRQAGGKKGRLRKDRYSALLMANASARALQRAPKVPAYRARGGFAGELLRDGPPREAGPMWVGPAWYTEAVEAAGGAAGFGAVVRRGD